MNGRDTSLEDFLNPVVLDTLETKINEVLEVEQFCIIYLNKNSVMTFRDTRTLKDSKCIFMGRNIECFSCNNV